MSRPGIASLALLLASGCCASRFHVRVPPPQRRAYDGIEVLPVAIETASVLSARTQSRAERNAALLTEYLAKRVRPGRFEMPVLRLRARFVLYREEFVFRPGEAVVLATFLDERGHAVAEGEVHAGNPSLGRGAYFSCTTVEVLGGGIVQFIEDELLTR